MLQIFCLGTGVPRLCAGFGTLSSSACIFMRSNAHALELKMASISSNKTKLATS